VHPQVVRAPGAQASAGFSPMPFGNSAQLSSRRDRVEIAQRFNGGTAVSKCLLAPEGRKNARDAPDDFFRSWRDSSGVHDTTPTDESVGYSRMSLRDKGRAVQGARPTFSFASISSNDGARQSNAVPLWPTATSVLASADISRNQYWSGSPESVAT